MRYCLNVHGGMLCDGPQDHDGGCTFTAGWMLVRRLEDDFVSLTAYAGDTTNELRETRLKLEQAIATLEYMGGAELVVDDLRHGGIEP